MSSLYVFTNKATVMGNEYDSDLSNNSSSVDTEIYQKNWEFVCIIVPKNFFLMSIPTMFSESIV
jgi:hypothetical protein